ncbi:MAG: molybdenum cofactor guanylyltransferase [Acidobacteriota bacterium]|jgi:molybdopterin-guanine dinucleotide biosynthesis protein A|nr:molybdenum cofactor guanylyltransferase [Acidobacteriota bacterium]
MTAQIDEEICAVILAGGKSRRMGQDKALINLNGRPLVEIMAKRVSPLTGKVFISANNPELFSFLPFQVVPDLWQDQGPLSGLHTVMSEHVYELYITLACDLPALPVSLVRRMLDVSEGFDAVIPRTLDGMAHPLAAVYRRTCLPVIEDALRKKANRFIDAFPGDGLRVRWMDPGEGEFTDGDLVNINTPDDLRRFQEATPYI